MLDLFSCRNCIHNGGQTRNVGRGAGFCVVHNSVLRDPAATTCKYLHRKDLAWFVVDEGTSEHAAQFARFPNLANLYTEQPLRISHYSQKYAWDTSSFDSLTNALSRYHKSQPTWVFIEALGGGVDGRRSIAQASMTRRYMDHCGTWKSSYRLVLAAIQEFSKTPVFAETDLVGDHSSSEEAILDVLFVRTSLVQEYGFHAGLETLQWITDRLQSLVELDWNMIKDELREVVPELIEEIIRHAKDNGDYFSSPEDRLYYDAQ